MPAAPDDWRRMGQEGYLSGATWTWKRYQVLSAEWEHEHCEFCFHKFLDASYAPSHAEMLREQPDASSPAGYTNVEDAERPAGKWWVCQACFEDFKDALGWTAVTTDPDGWPYHSPEPVPRPTAAEASRPQGWLQRPE